MLCGVEQGLFPTCSFGCRILHISVAVGTLTLEQNSITCARNFLHPPLLYHLLHMPFPMVHWTSFVSSILVACLWMGSHFLNCPWCTGFLASLLFWPQPSPLHCCISLTFHFLLLPVTSPPSIIWLHTFTHHRFSLLIDCSRLLAHFHLLFLLWLFHASCCLPTLSASCPWFVCAFPQVFPCLPMIFSSSFTSCFLIPL